jgi:hypothetical protein
MHTLTKKSILALLFALSFAACKKKQDKPDRTVRKVTYTFTPNGASSLIVYRSIKNGNEISRSPVSDIYIAYDEVMIGDKTTLKMSTTANVPPTYRVTIDYLGITIGMASTVVSDAEGKHVIIEKTFTKEDFE